MMRLVDALVSSLVIPGLVFAVGLVIIAAVVSLIKRALRGRDSLDPEAKEATVYSYGRKDFLMTRSEHEFFSVLKDLLHDRYQVFPQVHLSAVLDERIKGQNWRAAFRHINGKSVDFVVCDKGYARPLLAIELDDPSHDDENRRLRDEEVERIFRGANMPLLRFRDYKTLSREQIGAQIESALNNRRLS
jgi:hypothetical protein